MTEYEVAECLCNLDYTDKIYKTMERYQLYVMVQANSKRKVQLKDIMELPWDNAFLDKTEFEYDEKVEESLNKQANTLANMMSEGKLKFTDSGNLMKETPKIESEKKNG